MEHSKSRWPGILRELNTRTRLMGLICMTVEVAMVAALPFLPSTQRIYAFAGCAIVLAITLVRDVPERTPLRP